jgi:DNA gyrase subunit A
MQRPDLSFVSPEVVDYIEYLEAQISQSNQAKPAKAIVIEKPIREEQPLPAEPPSKVNIFTASHLGSAKKTARHLFSRQHRGGMGVFDIDVNSPDTPALLVSAEENQNLLVFTNKARVFRVNSSRFEQSPVRSRGSEIFDRITLENDETLVAALPEQATGYVAFISASGRIRSLRHHLFGEHMRPGMALYQFSEYGPLAAVSWTPGDKELLVVTKNGMGIRFSEKLVSPQGEWAIRLAKDDQVVSVLPVEDQSKVFVIGADGKGTCRLMSGFAPNKSTGGSGKQVMKNDLIIGALPIEENVDIFVISHLGKIIRFPADEVPETEGVIQGVNCMSLRSDEAVFVTQSGPIQI